MKIKQVKPLLEHTLEIVSDEDTNGTFDIKPYLHYKAFQPLQQIAEFMKINNGGYFVEWECGADLSADTIEAKMIVKEVV